MLNAPSRINQNFNIMQYDTMRFVGADMLEELFSELQEMYAHVEIIAIHATYFVYAYII